MSPMSKKHQNGGGSATMSAATETVDQMTGEVIPFPDGTEPAKTAESTPLVAPAATALAKPQANSMPTGRLEGAEKDDVVLPRVHIFQGLPKEAQLYGRGHNPGDMINVLTGDTVTEKRFCPIMGHKQWIKWREPRGSGMIYNFRVKAEVPPADLEWPEGGQPAAQEYINWVVLFEGHDTPLVLSFTKTSIITGKAINTCEGLRGKKGPGLYELEMQEKFNDKGAWISPRLRPVGNPSPELLNAVELMYAALAGVTVSASLDPADEFDPATM